MHDKTRLLVFLSVVGGILLPGIILAFIFLNFWFALFASLFVAMGVFGLFYGSHGPRGERRNRMEAEAAQRGDAAFFIDPRRPM